MFIVVHVGSIQWSDQTDCGIIITVLSYHYSHQVTQHLTWRLSSFLQWKFHPSLATGFLSKEKVFFVQMEERICTLTLHLALDALWENNAEHKEEWIVFSNRNFFVISMWMLHWAESTGEKILCEIFIVVYTCSLIIAILLSVTYPKALECWSECPIK